MQFYHRKHLSATKLFLWLLIQTKKKKLTVSSAKKIPSFLPQQVKLVTSWKRNSVILDEYKAM